MRVHESDAARVRDSRAVSTLAEARRASGPARLRLEQRVVLDYLRLADAVANRYRRAGIDARDLRQVAYVGLMKAIRGFDPSYGRCVASFAVPTISGEIKRYLRDSSWAVRPPRSVQELSLELLGVSAELTQRLGRAPTLTELAEATGKSLDEVAEAERCGEECRPLSIDASTGGEDEGQHLLLDALAGDDREFERAETRLLLDEALRTLTPTDRRIVRLRFTLTMTQTEIADEVGISQMQVSRMLTRILAELREELIARGITG